MFKAFKEVIWLSDFLKVYWAAGAPTDFTDNYRAWFLRKLHCFFWCWRFHALEMLVLVTYVIRMLQAANCGFSWQITLSLWLKKKKYFLKNCPFKSVIQTLKILQLLSASESFWQKHNQPLKALIFLPSVLHFSQCNS